MVRVIPFVLIKKYYIFGMRPVYSEYSDTKTHLNTFAFNWETGSFDLNNHCYTRLIFNKVDELEIISEREFNDYVARLKKERNLP
jgi:virulence-associated protein VapD